MQHAQVERAELERLDQVARAREGHFAVADQSAAELQWRHISTGMATVLPGLADVEQPDWAALLAAGARGRDARDGSVGDR